MSARGRMAVRAAAGVGFGEPEVEHCYDGAVGSHLDIHRLEVAVDDTGVVRRREGFGGFVSQWVAPRVDLRRARSAPQRSSP